VGVVTFFWSDTTFTGFTAFFGAGLGKWRRRFYRQFLKIPGENPVMWLFESTPFSPPLIGRLGRVSSAFLLFGITF
jgi:hypothetical protein